MRECDQATITDAAFKHLTGIRALDLTGCNQATITDSMRNKLRAGVPCYHDTHDVDSDEYESDSVPASSGDEG